MSLQTETVNTEFEVGLIRARDLMDTYIMAVQQRSKRDEVLVEILTALPAASSDDLSFHVDGYRKASRLCRVWGDLLVELGLLDETVRETFRYEPKYTSLMGSVVDE